MNVLVLALALVQFTTPNGDRIDINSVEITSLREPHGTTEMHWAQGTRCLIVMSNGIVKDMGFDWYEQVERAPGF